MITKRVKKNYMDGTKNRMHSRLECLDVRKTTAVSFTCESDGREEREKGGVEEGNLISPAKQKSYFCRF